MDRPFNGGHNTVAGFDIDVVKGSIGDLGSWLGSSCVVGPNDGTHQKIELFIRRIGER